MKRYLLFRGRDYYPSGGIDDLSGDFDTIEECIAECRRDMVKDLVDKHLKLFNALEIIKCEQEYSWGYVYDTETRQKVWDQKQITA